MTTLSLGAAAIVLAVLFHWLGIFTRLRAILGFVGTCIVVGGLFGSLLTRGVTLVSNLTSDRCDMSIAATYITPARAEQAAFTRTYAEETKTAFVPQSSKATTYADIDVPTSTIAVRAGTAEETYAKEFFKKAKIKTLTSDATQPNFLDVAAGRSDAVFAGYVGGLLFLKQNPNLKLRPLGDKLLDPSPFAFMLPLGQPSLQKFLNDEITELERTGKLEAIRRKWIPGLPAGK